MFRLVGMSDPCVMPEPVPLSYWLDDDASESSSKPTMLRILAYRWALRRTRLISLWGSTVFIVVVLLLSSPGAFLSTILVVLGGLFAVSAILCMVYYRYRPLPSVKDWEPDVWIRTTRGGVLAAVAFMVSMMLLALLQQSTSAFEGHPWLFTLTVLSSTVGAVMYVVQGWHYEHARQLFRRHIDKNERARTALEDLAMNPPTSTRLSQRFGPL